MSRKAPLFAPSLFTEDLRVRSLSAMAQLLFIKLACLANDAGGYVAIGTVHVSIEKAAASMGLNGLDIAALLEEIDRSLLDEDEHGWFIPEMKAAQMLRDKRSKAGKRGGESTTAQRSDVGKVRRGSSSVVCLSKAKSANKSVPSDRSVKKEKRTKKEKNNNKYIYISDQKISVKDRGSSENPAYLKFSRYSVFKKEYLALQREFPFFGEDKIDELLANHDEWMGQNPQVSERNWHIPLVAGWRKMHARLEAAAANDDENRDGEFNPEQCEVA